MITPEMIEGFPVVRVELQRRVEGCYRLGAPVVDRKGDAARGMGLGQAGIELKRLVDGRQDLLDGDVGAMEGFEIGRTIGKADIGFRIGRIELQGARIHLPGPDQRQACADPENLLAFQEIRIGLDTCVGASSMAARSSGKSLTFNCSTMVLVISSWTRENIGQVAVEALGPHMAVAGTLDQLRRDADLAGRFAHAALD